MLLSLSLQLLDIVYHDSMYKIQVIVTAIYACRAAVVPLRGIDSFVASDFGEERILVVVEGEI